MEYILYPIPNVETITVLDGYVYMYRLAQVTQSILPWSPFVRLVILAIAMFASYFGVLLLQKETFLCNNIEPVANKLLGLAPLAALVNFIKHLKHKETTKK